MKLTKQGQVTPPIEIDYDDVKICIKRLEALNHPTRRRILLAIEKLDEKATATNIIEAISLEQRVVDKHLTILTREKVVDKRKNIFQKIIYNVNHETIEKAARFVEELNKNQ